MSLLDCTREILALTEKVSGRPVRVQEEPSLNVLAAIKTARGSAPMHMITYRPIPNRQPDYHICYQCGFVLRLFGNPPESRFEFGPAPDASDKMERLLSDASLPPQARPMKDILLSGLLTQLRSIPIGLRIDDWLWSEYSELQEQQIASARIQLQQNAQVLAPSVRKSFPKRVVSANTTMNASFAMFWAEKLSDPSISLPYRSIGADVDGKTLLGIFGRIDSRPTSDWMLLDAWAKELGLQGWYDRVPYKLED